MSIGDTEIGGGYEIGGGLDSEDGGTIFRRGAVTRIVQHSGMTERIVTLEGDIDSETIL